jgi:predicted transcriptional regulator
MTMTETITVRLDRKDKVMLAQLASETKRSKSFLAGEAIRAYIAQEADIIAHVHEGLADMKAGRLMSNDEAYKSWTRAINKTARKKA